MLSRFTALALLAVSIHTSAQRIAPAYPLITHDPYFSIWSFTDTINTSVTRHWTGTSQPITGHVTVDGVNYRVIGSDPQEYKTIESKPNADVLYTTTNSDANWYETDYVNENWKPGRLPVSNQEDGAGVKWEGRDIWYRRTIELEKNLPDNIFIETRYDDEITVYLNGVNIYESKDLKRQPTYIQLTSTQKRLLKPGKNVLAIHGVNTFGEGFADFELTTPKQKLAGPEHTAKQKSIALEATRTIYTLQCGPVEVKAEFLSPLLLNDLHLLARPVSYVIYNVKSTDGKQHNVTTDLNISSVAAINHIGQQTNASAYTSHGLRISQAGSATQPVLAKTGDDLRIDWGYLYLATPTKPGSIATYQNNGNKQQTLKATQNIGPVGTTPKRVYYLLGYDDIYSLEYFQDRLQPFWKTEYHTSIEDELQLASTGFQNIYNRCVKFDDSLRNALNTAGGKEYAELCMMAYRQCIAAHKLLRANNGDILFMSKENFSGGCVNTVDVTYPSAPLFLVFNPDLLKGMLNGIFYYSESGTWKKPFAAHDLGFYPQANAQAYREDMPVEESGNMIILTAAICKKQKNYEYATLHWKSLSQWVEFLLKDGFDPANQLCTDDFAGHLARNANLSLKAIMGIRSYSFLAGKLGYPNLEEQYADTAAAMAKRWVQMADLGDHYALTFDKGDTWSQKYNLVWDKLMDYNVFPQEVADKEIAYYLSHQQKYGLPLDSRKTYTKSDWIIWTSLMARSPQEFQALIHPIYRFALETPNRVPLCDWHETLDAKQMNFQARSVVAGYFMKILKF